MIYMVPRIERSRTGLYEMEHDQTMGLWLPAPSPLQHKAESICLALGMRLAALAVGWCCCRGRLRGPPLHSHVLFPFPFIPICSLSVPVPNIATLGTFVRGTLLHLVLDR